MTRNPIRIGLLALSLLVGCRDAVKEARTADFARLYVRLRLASSGMEGRPQEAQQARTEVLRSSGVDLVGYRRLLRELQADPDQWELFWTRVQILTDSLDKKPKKKGS
jgi:hypothetical protein